MHPHAHRATQLQIILIHTQKHKIPTLKRTRIQAYIPSHTHTHTHTYILYARKPPLSASNTKIHAYTHTYTHKQHSSAYRDLFR